MKYIMFNRHGIFVVFLIFLVCNNFTFATGDPEQVKQQILEILVNLEYIVDDSIEKEEFIQHTNAFQTLNNSKRSISQILERSDELQVINGDQLTELDIRNLKLLNAKLQIITMMSNLKNEIISVVGQENGIIHFGKKKYTITNNQLIPMDFQVDLPLSDEQFPNANYNDSVFGSTEQNNDIIVKWSQYQTQFENFFDAIKGDFGSVRGSDQFGTLNPFDLTVDYVNELLLGINIGEDRGNITPLFLDYALKSIYEELADICNDLTSSIGISFGVSVGVKFDVGVSLNFVCILFDTLKNVQTYVYEKRQFKDSDIDSAEIEGSYDRLEYVHRQVKGVKGDILSNLNDLAIQMVEKINFTQTNIVKRIDLAETNLDARLNQVEINLTHQVNENETKLDYSQWTLDSSIEQKKIHLQVVELKNKSEYLIGADEGGIPVSLDIPFVSVKVASNSKQFDIHQIESPEISCVGEGLYLLKINLPQKINDANLLILQVKHGHSGSETYGAYEHYGFSMLPLSGNN